MSEQRMQATGGCRCDTNTVRYEYTRAPFEVHYCLCTDCTDISGGAMALIAVVERDAFRITQGEEKIRNFDTKATAHRRFCGRSVRLSGACQSEKLPSDNAHSGDCCHRHSGRPRHLDAAQPVRGPVALPAFRRA